MVNQPVQNRVQLSPDKPLVDPADDKLGYAPFAKMLAESVCNLAPRDGFVMALYGDWGSGKSTVLEFLEFYLNEMPEKSRPVVVRFNPWWFSGTDEIFRQFFAQLQTTLSARAAWTQGLIKSFGTFAESLSEAPGPQAGIAKILSIMSRHTGSGRDIPTIKKSIADQLRAKGKQIVVIIDDIDRLTSEEIRDLFRTVKAVGDFPYITYLMAFDKGVVTMALEGMQGIPGDQYLEKIVQAPFELPLPDKESLRRLFTEQLEEILAVANGVPIDTDYWRTIYFDGIESYIRTPRDVVVLINALAVTYPAVSGEVNPVDFIAIETLRVFEPDVYDIIRRNGSSFTLRSDAGTIGQPRPEDHKALHESWLGQHDGI